MIITPFTLAGRHGTDHHRRRADARACRGAVRHHARPDRRARHPDHVRQLHVQRGHEVRLAGLRNARVHQGGLRRRAAGAPHRRAVALLERHGLQRTGRAGHLRVADEPVGCPAGRLSLRAARGRVARGRADRIDREVHSRCRDAADVRGIVPAGVRVCGGDRHRCGYRGGSRRALLRRRPHDAALPRRLLYAAGLGLAQFRRLVRRRSKDRHRARRGVWRETLAAFQPPPIDAAVVEKLNAFVERRRKEGGAPPVS